jgi:hypothetical protein
MPEGRRNHVCGPTVGPPRKGVFLPGRELLQLSKGENRRSIMRRQEAGVAHGDGHDRNRLLGAALKVEKLHPVIPIARRQFARSIGMPVISKIFKSSISGSYFPVKVQPFCPAAYPLPPYRLIFAVIVIRREMLAQVRSPILDLCHGKHASIPSPKLRCQCVLRAGLFFETQYV